MVLFLLFELIPLKSEDSVDKDKYIFLHSFYTVKTGAYEMLFKCVGTYGGDKYKHDTVVFMRHHV